jgi:hypothetical protein
VERYAHTCNFKIDGEDPIKWTVLHSPPPWSRNLSIMRRTGYAEEEEEETLSLALFSWPVPLRFL